MPAEREAVRGGLAYGRIISEGSRASFLRQCGEFEVPVNFPASPL